MKIQSEVTPSPPDTCLDYLVTRQKQSQITGNSHKSQYQIELCKEIVLYKNYLN